MTNRLFRTIVILTAALVATVATAAPGAQTPASPPATPPAQSPAQSPPASPPSSPTPAPAGDAVYAIGGDRVVPPRVQREVKPTYTAEAMRSRIQGRVRLQGVVERDGTISGITIVQSLDTQFGLDRAAVDALTQWRFQPGRLADGTPVRVLVNVDLTFTLRDGPPTQGWPQGFADATSLPGAVDETADAPGLRMTIARPAAWIAAGTPSEWMRLSGPGSAEWVSVIHRDDASFDLSGVSPNARASRLVDIMQKFLAAPQVEALATGQVPASPEDVWVWSTFRIPNIASLPGVPQNDLVSEARAWMFTRTINDKVLLVQCVLLVPRDIDPAAVPARIEQAVADFAPIVKSIRVETIEK